MNSDHFSALDRHAVFSGSDDGFPWYASTMLVVEASEVVCLRLEKFAHGDDDCEREAHLMVTEKIFAAIEAGASWVSGATFSDIVGRYRERVAANARRLSASS
jgi:hypothetical protein